MKKVFFMMICMALVMVACNVRSAQDKQSENVVEDSIATTMEGNAVAAGNSADAEAVMSATEPTEEEIAPAEPAKIRQNRQLYKSNHYFSHILA